VLVIGELVDLVDEAATLDYIGMHGPAHGMYLLAATTRINGLDEAQLAPFATRLVLQTLNEEQSIRLLGQPDAADLGEGGDALLRIDGRLPVRLRGFRVADDDLHRLVQVMRAEFAQQSMDDLVESRGTDANEIASDDCLATIDAQSQPGISDPAPKSKEFIRAASEEPIPVEACEEDAPPGMGSQGNGDLRPRVLETPTAVRTGDILTAETTVADGRDAGGARAAMPTVHQGAADGEPNGLHRHPLIWVRCFGRLRVMSGDRELSPAGTTIGRQYKAWEILAFLAVQPDGVASKEKLLAALWPNADAGRAASRLRTTLTRLRTVLVEQVPGLTAEVVRRDGDGSCRLDTGVVQSDVHHFLALTQSTSNLRPTEIKSRYEQALALYEDDLLTEPLYEWVHERDDDGLSLQERWRETSRSITNELAGLYHQEGAFARAVPLYKCLLQREPALEDVVRDLYRCYRKLGDLNSLIREDRQLRQALREAYFDPSDPTDDPAYYQPDPETVSLFDQIRAELETKSAKRASANGHRRVGKG
jgi:DNA-binding SARP family transcriptional activator